MFRFFTAFLLGVTTLFSGVTHNTVSVMGNITSHMATSSSQQTTLSQDQLLALASNKYADGNLPLGDNKYSTTSPQKGYVYLCNAHADGQGGGAQAAGSWIHG